ncbi:MAG TPA: peptidase C39 family protein [Humibacillus xanthopallidus]|nr:peptidase C39 family protein [Humibacillus xanthopallidus]
MTERHATFAVWEDGFDWAPSRPITYADPHVTGAPELTYAARSWESPVVTTDFGARELIPSWNARTPAGTWLTVEVRVASEQRGDPWTPWLVLARWAEGDPAEGAPITRTTVRGQALDVGRVATDCYRANAPHRFDRWQVRVTGFRPAGASEGGADDSHDSHDSHERHDREDADGGWPEVTLVSGAALAFDVPDDEPTSAATIGRAVEVAVPPHSQRLHLGTFPQWDNGGESWCSPTSTAMLLEHWGVAPAPEELAWVGHDTDPAVVHGVRHVYDPAFAGAGNWTFNTAYAATRGLRAYVTRLRDLTEAERFVAAGIPLVVSVTFRRDQLDGAGYDTNGHLLTIVGFTADGDVVSNDPNSHTVASNEQVRTVYRRDQFERVWVGDDGGLAYVMTPPGVALPEPPAEANWG